MIINGVSILPVPYDTLHSPPSSTPCRFPTCGTSHIPLGSSRADRNVPCSLPLSSSRCALLTEGQFCCQRFTQITCEQLESYCTAFYSKRNCLLYMPALFLLCWFMPGHAAFHWMRPGGKPFPGCSSQICTRKPGSTIYIGGVHEYSLIKQPLVTLELMQHALQHNTASFS